MKDSRRPLSVLTVCCLIAAGAMVGETVSFCSACGAGVQVGSRFCSSCGKNLCQSSSLLSFLQLTTGRKFALLGVAIVLFGATFGLQSYLEKQNGLVRPTALYQPPANPQPLPPGHPGGEIHGEPSEETPEIKALRVALEASPEDLSKMRAYAAALGDVLRSDPHASARLALDAIDVLGRILQKEPNDAEALVMMADVSFDQKAFTKALDFYQRYLKITPTDLGARARYASTLTFLGRFDDSISELNEILIKDSKNFPAMAYLAITYAQKGDTTKAKQVAASALAIAPSDEARARFSSFVSSLSEESNGESEQQSKIPLSSPSARESLDSDSIGIIVSAVKASPIAGPKFVRAELRSKQEVVLYFKNFPMSMMPPFAKEKFFAGIRTKATEAIAAGVEIITFVDSETGETLDTLTFRNK